MIDLVLGGNKSGKSDFGLELLAKAPSPSTIVVTGKSRDLAFRDQITRHRKSRSKDILVWEVEVDLAASLRELQDHSGGVLIDSLDFWLFSLMNHHNAAGRRQARHDFLDVLMEWKREKLIMVSTEMGLGPLAFDGEIRAFARDLGQLNREIASLCTNVYLVIAGLAQQLK